MSTYLLMTALSTVALYCSQKGYKKTNYISIKLRFGIIYKRQIFLILSMLPLICVSGFRYYVGTDYGWYLSSYIKSVFSNGSYSMEPLYYVLCLIGKYFGSEQLIFFLTAVIFTIGFIGFIKENSDDWSMSCILLLLTGTFSQSLNIMRQMMALAICVYSIKYLKNEKYIYYLAGIGIASMFHTTALIYIPLVFSKTFIESFRLSFNKKILIIVSFLLISVLSNSINSTLFKLIDTFANKYVHFYGSIQDTGSSTALLLENLAILCFCLFFYNSGTDKKMFVNKLLILLQFCACFVLAIGLPSVNRIAYLFIPVQVVLIPNIMEMIKMKRILKLLILIFYFLFWYYFFFHLNVSATFPYNSIFTK